MSDLRELAERLLQVTREHPMMSVALPVVQNAADHLCAIARCHETNQLLEEKRRGNR